MKTFNLQQQPLDITKITEDQVVILPFEEFEGKRVNDVLQELLDNYTEEYYLPTLNDLKYFTKNPDKIPETLKDSNNSRFYSFGSTICAPFGDCCVPVLLWDGSSFSRRADRLDASWDSDDRALLIKRKV